MLHIFARPLLHFFAMNLRNLRGKVMKVIRERERECECSTGKTCGNTNAFKRTFLIK